MNFLSWFSADRVLRTCEVVAMLSGIIAVCALIGQILAGRVVNARQALRISELETEAAGARLKTAQIQSIVEWRTLSKEQIAKLESILSTKPSSVRLICVANDPEALFFSIEISKAFKNWSVFAANRSYSGILVFGLSIVGPNESDVNLVRDAFRAADIAFSDKPINVSGTMDFGTVVPGPEVAVEIIVGSKLRPLP